MSYPTIGMPGLVPGDEWTPAYIENLLRDGHHIYEYLDDGYSSYNQLTGKFQFDYTGKCPEDEDCKKVWEYDTFLELAIQLAFWGKDFL